MRIGFFLALFVSQIASAQYSVLYHLGGLNGTNTTLTANSVSNYTAFAPLSIARTRYVAVQASFAALSDLTNSVSFTLQTSLDYTNWNAVALLTATSAGTNRIVAFTNSIDVGMAQWLRLSTVTNSVGAALTNVVCLAAYKVAIAQRPYDALGYELQPASGNLTNWSVLETNGVFFIATNATAPTNTSSPIYWAPATYNGQPLRLPLYR